MIKEFFGIKKSNDDFPLTEGHSTLKDSVFTRLDIENFVQQLRPALRSLKVGTEVMQLSNSTCVFEVSSGESYGFRIIAGEKSYFLKIAKSGLKQSYLQEYEQELEITKYFRKRMNQIGLSFPHYVFVSETWCLTEFEDGSPLVTLPPLINSFIDELENYMKKSKTKLFDKVGIDLMPSNIILRKDNSLCWLDPFYLK